MIDAFKLGGDFHSRTAYGMYDHIQDDIKKGVCLYECECVCCQTDMLCSCNCRSKQILEVVEEIVDLFYCTQVSVDWRAVNSYLKWQFKRSGVF